MTEEAAAEEVIEPTDGEYIFLDVMEGGSSTVILNESALVGHGVVALHVCGGCVYAICTDMKLHKLEEVKGMPSTTASVRAIRATKPE